MKHPIPPSGIMPIARELGELLGGEPWCKSIEVPKPAAMPVRPRPSLYDPETQAEMAAIYEGKLM